MADSLAWHGIEAIAKWVEGDPQSNAMAIQEMAAEQSADLIVMGAYSRTPTQETLFGGCTQSLLTDALQPVLFMH